jgi:hypothetical protein
MSTSPKQAALIIGAFFAVFLVFAFYYRVTHLPVLQSAEQQLNDTLFKDHSKIPEDKATFSTRATRRKTVDSLIESAPAPNSLHWPAPTLTVKEDSL